eukprot:354903-Chlamydomonas_euryale.AAC.32
MLLLPTKSCAMPTIVIARLVSPWWYAALSDTYPARLPTCGGGGRPGSISELSMFAQPIGPRQHQTQKGRSR